MSRLSEHTGYLKAFQTAHTICPLFESILSTTGNQIGFCVLSYLLSILQNKVVLPCHVVIHTQTVLAIAGLMNIAKMRWHSLIALG